MEKSEPALPLKFLSALTHDFPDVWRYADRARAMCGTDLPEWPRQVFLPYAAWYAIACRLYGTPRLALAQIQTVGKLAAAGAWRPGQDIIRFEPDLAEALMATELVGDIPADVLWRLPSWCVYVEQDIEVYHVPYQGFFAYLEEDANDGHRELRLHFLGENGDFGFPIHLGDYTLAYALEAMTHEIWSGADLAGLDQISAACLSRTDVFLSGAQKAVNLLLYLCAYGLDDEKARPQAKAAYPSARKTKKGWRLYPPDKPVIHTPGQKLAQALREAGNQGRQSGSHSSPRPHIRRGHWHGYWLGAKEKRRFDLRWLPPIAVGMREEGE